MVVVRIVILSARPWQDGVDLNFLRMGEPENTGRDSHPGRRLSPQASSVLCRYWEMRAWPSLLCLTLAGHPTSQSLRLLRCKMGMAKGPCKDTLRNSNIYKTSVSISGRKFSLSGMSVPLKLFKAKVRSLLQGLSFTDDLLMGLTLFDCRMGC